MIAYVESNFPLEIARGQEQASDALELLSLSEAGRIGLTFSVFAVCEPFSTVTRYGADRSRFVELLRPHVHELGRLRAHQELAAVLQPLASRLLQIGRTEMNGLETAVHRMLKSGRCLGLTPAVFSDALELERTLGLSPQDAIVLASIFDDLPRQPKEYAKCFISRNSKDFDDPTVRDRLESFGCRYIAKFSDGLSFVQSKLDPSC